MKLQILSYNVWGLNIPTKVRKLQRYIRLTKPTYDVILLQEHKLYGEKARELGRNLWPDASCICLDARLSYILNENGTGRGGICILVSPYLKYLIDSCGSLRDNRILWITFKGTPIGKMGILIVYMPNCSCERGMLCKNLSSVRDTSHAWILGGDWNMTEQQCDKSSSCSRILSQLETSSWNFLKSSLGLVDHFSAGRNLRYSWDNLRNEVRVLARLDRFYTSEKDINKNMILEYRIKGNNGLSNHMPICLRLNLKQEQARTSCYKLNLAWLTCFEVKTQITRLWKAFPDGTHFLVKFRRVIRFYRTYYKEQTEAQRRSEVELRCKFGRLQGVLYEDPTNLHIQKKLDLCAK